MLLGRIGDKHPIKPARKPETSNLKYMPQIPTHNLKKFRIFQT